MKRMLIAIAAISLTALVGGVSMIASGQQGQTIKAANKSNGGDAKIIADVRAVLDTQVAAWNRGDIEEFMKGYARSDDIVFVSGDTVTRGWQTVLDRYKKNYSSREKMGQLTFSELEIKPISPDAAVAVGRWQLARAGDTPKGRFTLILRRTPQGWRIVHDHTSAAS